jgi:hypothetical protein
MLIREKVEFLCATQILGNEIIATIAQILARSLLLPSVREKHTTGLREYENY